MGISEGTCCGSMCTRSGIETPQPCGGVVLYYKTLKWTPGEFLAKSGMPRAVAT